jgi:hypothetical protein
MLLLTQFREDGGLSLIGGTRLEVFLQLSLLLAMMAELNEVPRGPQWVCRLEEALAQQTAGGRGCGTLHRGESSKAKESSAYRKCGWQEAQGNIWQMKTQEELTQGQDRMNLSPQIHSSFGCTLLAVLRYWLNFKGQFWSHSHCFLPFPLLFIQKACAECTQMLGPGNTSTNEVVCAWSPPK